MASANVTITTKAHVFNTPPTTGKAKQRTRLRRKSGLAAANDATEAGAELVPFSDVLDPPPFDRPDESPGGPPEGAEETQDWTVHVRAEADDAVLPATQAGAEEARDVAAAPAKASVQLKDGAAETSTADTAPAPTGKVYVLPAARLAKPRRRSSGLIRVAACLITGVTLVAWHLEQRPQPADAAEPQTAPPAPLGPMSPAEQLARYERALQQIEAGDAGEGAALLRGLAQSGFVMAQYRLAKAYADGEGVAADLTLARHWTERAAMGGNRQAMHDLGAFYFRGEAVARDDATALRWFRQAADLDLAESQYNLGIMFEQGRGVRADAGEALFWFMLAARQGDAAAAERASVLQAELSGEQVQQAHARMQAFQPRPLNVPANAVPTPIVAPASPAAEAVSEDARSEPAPEDASRPEATALE